MSKRLFHLGRGLFAVAVLFSIAHATPEPAAWRRTILLGDNDQYFFRYVTDSVHPGSYFRYSRSLRLEKVRKSDDHVVQTFPLRSVEYSQHPDSLSWSETSDSLPSFDLPAYLRANKIALAFPSDLIQIRVFQIDGGGVWEVLHDGRVRLATHRELVRQIPSLGDDPHVVGIEQTCPDPSKNLYLRIVSGSATWDDDWSEDLLMIRGALLR